MGLETALAVTLKFVEDRTIRLMDLVKLLSTNPARIVGLKGKGILKPGSDADITIFDPSEKIKVDPARFRSKGRNSPFAGWNLKGRVKCTIVAGKVVFREGDFSS